MSEAECPQHAMLQAAEMVEGCRKGRYFKLTHKYQYLLLLHIQVTVVNTALKNDTIYKHYVNIKELDLLYSFNVSINR